MEREISVTAENFIFSWNRACKDSACQFGNFFGEQGIDMVNGQAMRSALEAGKFVEDIPLGMQAPDEKTLVVKLTHPSAVFEWMMTFPLFFPIQQQFYEKWGLPYCLSPKSFLANGPCCLTNWNKDSSLTFEKNDLYWDEKVVHMDEFVFDIIPDSAAALAYKAGEAD